jgi:hypothetical protein
LFTCMVPSNAAAESMFTHHMHTAPCGKCWRSMVSYCSWRLQTC